MIPVRVTNNIAKVVRDLGAGAAKDQSQVAIAKALTFTAERVQRAIADRIGTVFDRPTRFTRSATYKRPATVDNLSAEVFLKDQGDGGVQPAHYLYAQVQGGDRRLKSTEKQLVSLGLMRSSERMVPTRFALQIFGDAYGNVSRGLISKVRSQLKLNRTAGSSSNATNSRRSKAKRAEFRIFVTTAQTKSVWGRGGRGGEREGARQNLRRGIYLDVPGRRVRPLFLFLSVSYRTRLDFYAIAEQVIEAELPRQIEKALARLGRTT